MGHPPHMAMLAFLILLLKILDQCSETLRVVGVHGEHPEWDYIRHKENQRALKAVSTVFREALAKREAHFQLKVGLYKTYIGLLTQLRNVLASQRGDVAILSNNQCYHVK